MIAPISFGQVHRIVNSGSRHMAGHGRIFGLDTSLELLLSLIIVIVIIVLLLSQEDPGVGMAL